MKMTVIRFIWSLLPLSAIMLTPLHGQDEEQRTLTFKVFAIGQAPSAPFFVQSGGNAQEVRFYNGRIGDNVEYTGSPEIVFHERTGTGENISYRPLARVTPVETSDEFILVFSKDRQSDTWRVFALPAARSEFPEGSYYLSNLTGDQVIFKIGEEVVNLPPGSFQQVNPPITPSVSTEVLAAREVNGEPRIVYRSQWPSYEKRRNMVLVYNDPGSRRGLMVQRYMDVVEDQSE